LPDSTPDQPLSGPALRRARRAVAAVFLANGFGIGAWSGHIPALKERLALDPAPLSLAFLAMAVGGLLVMPVTGWLTARLGSRRCVIAASTLFGFALMLPALAQGLVGLCLATFFLGIMTGAMDVAMNTHGTAVQSGYGRAIMSSFHAFFSLGGLLGAGAASLMLVVFGGPGVDLVIAGALILVVLLASFPGLLRTAPEPRSGGGITLPDRRALGVGLLCALVMLTEGAMHDWSGVYMLTVIGAPASVAALGFGAFAAAMTAGRLLGDRIVRRLGREPTLILSGILTSVGVAVVLAAPGAGVAMAGFALAGLGLANTVPILFSAGAAIEGVPPGVGVAMVATIGYGGFLLGPPLLGFTAQAAGLVVAFVLLALPGLVVATVAGKAPRRRAGSARGKSMGADGARRHGQRPSTDPD
jgi:MFS family permease